MAIWSRLGLSGPVALIWAALLAILIGGAYLTTQRPFDPVRQAEPAAPTPAPETQADTAEAAEAAPAESPAPDLADAGDSDEQSAALATESEPTPQEAEAAQAPTLDVVRVEPDGATVLAGAAEAGQLIRIFDGEQEVARTTADAAGKFVALFDLPPSDVPRSLTVQGITADGVSTPASGTVLIAATPKPAAPAVAEAQPETAATTEQAALADTADPAADDKADDTTGQVAPAVTADAAPQEPEAPAVVLADDSGVKVLQPAAQPAAPSPVVTSNVVIDTITYDTQGEVALAGRGNADGFVRLYLDGRPVRTTEIDVDGAWSADLPDIDAGVYTLRIDEVDAEGAVTSRVETPFQREEVDLVTKTAKAVTIQPGFTLWAIARDRYGAGEQYVRVYEANRDLIRDPDLIYPGQIFTFPEDG